MVKGCREDDSDRPHVKIGLDGCAGDAEAGPGTENKNAVSIKDSALMIDR